MKRTIAPKQNGLPPLKVFSELITRMRMASMLGMQYSNDRDLYKLYGYKRELTYDDYWQHYKRQDMAKAIIDRPIKDCWRGPLVLLESDDDQDTQFEKQWKELEKTLKLRNKFIRLDKLTGLGRYGVLFFGLNDADDLSGLINPVSGTPELLYVRPFGEDLATVDTYVIDPRDPRYGQPELYEIKLAKVVKGSHVAITPVKVHHSRVMHITDSPLDSEIYGTPRLEVVFNRLMDLEKLVGGSAEMFWKGARPGFQGKVDKEFTLGEDELKKLEDQWEEYEHSLRRLITSEGVDLEALQSQISDPKGHVEVQITMISAVTGIPSRVLTGSERGELASSQDTEHWNTLIQARREEFAEQSIIRPFVEKCVELGVLPEPDKDKTFSVQWEDLFAVGDKEKAEVGRIRASALKEYTSNSMSEIVVPPQAFYQFFLGLGEDEIELIDEMRKAMVKEEEKEIREQQRQEREQPIQEEDEE